MVILVWNWNGFASSLAFKKYLKFDEIRIYFDENTRLSQQNRGKALGSPGLGSWLGSPDDQESAKIWTRRFRVASGANTGKHRGLSDRRHLEIRLFRFRIFRSLENRK